MWLVRFATVAVMGSLAFGANAAGRKKRAPRRTTAAPVAPDPEPSPATLAADQEGPFAPTGKTGKLKEEPPPPALIPAGDEPAATPEPEKLGLANINMVFGAGKTGNGSQIVDLKVASFLIGATYKVTPALGLRLRFPISSGEITADNYPTYNSTSLGNVEVAAVYTVQAEEHLHIPLELALAAPTATGDIFAPPDDLSNTQRSK